MSMLARRYDPVTLERWSLINLVVADEALESTTMSIAEEFAHGPTIAHAATKQLADLAANEGVVAADLAAGSNRPLTCEEIDRHVASGALVSPIPATGTTTS
jgi:enoyl-CoA hydratase/carnithine racemase